MVEGRDGESVGAVVERLFVRWLWIKKAVDGVLVQWSRVLVRWLCSNRQSVRAVVVDHVQWSREGARGVERDVESSAGGG